MIHDTTTARLLGDIGGTNARFAWQSQTGATFSDLATYPCAQYDSLSVAIRHYLREHDRPVPADCAIGIANPVIGDRVQMTNHHWSFSINELKHELGFRHLAVINDFTALALSLPGMRATDLRCIGDHTSAVAGAAMALIGPGTGLGVGGLLPDGNGRMVVIVSEGGHVTLAASNHAEAAVLAHLRGRFGHVSAERVLSGPGLVNLYQALCQLAGRSAPRDLGPSAVITLAAQSDAHAVAARDMFFAFLGNMAGNLALTLGARGGVYLGGGILPRLADELQASVFHARFVDKGRMRAYLEPIPVWLITAEVSPALIGASRALDQIVTAS
jgi:glucokinase